MNRQFADWRPKPIVAITRDMVEARHREYTVLSPAEANRAMRYLRALFVFASDYRDSNGEAVVPDNPVRRLSAKRLWNRVERRTRYIEPEQLRDWWNAVQSLKNKPQYPSREVLRDYLSATSVHWTAKKRSAMSAMGERRPSTRDAMRRRYQESFESHPTDGTLPVGRHAPPTQCLRQRVGVRESAHRQTNY